MHRVRAGTALPRIHEMRYGSIFFSPKRGEAPSLLQDIKIPLLDDEELLLKLCERYGVELDLT